MSRLRNFDTQDVRAKVITAIDVVRFVFFGIGIVIIIAASSLGVLVANQLKDVPDVGYLEHYHPVDSIEIYDCKDRLVCAINREDTRKVVPLEHISKYMQDAVIAAEDRHFYEHHGVNAVSVVRAMVVNLFAGKVVEGGSTITQQLVKNLFFPEVGRTLVRKIAEAIVAEQIECRFTKEQILAMYLNEIYFGNGAHGIEQAAQIYFNKSAQRLTLSESAFLAAVIKAPSVNGAIEHRQDVLVRQREIIDAMAELRLISDIESRVAQHAELEFYLRSNRAEQPPFTKYPYYVSYVLDLIHKHFDDNQIRLLGLRVYTNLDPVAQDAAEQALARDIKVAPRGIDEEALVSMSVKDGSVRAMVGGAHDFWGNQWNCATSAHTVGSAFKPFVYLTAFLREDLKPNSVIVDSPLTVNQIDMTYAPKNYDGKYMGKITVRQALALSRNTCAVRVAQKVGVSNVVETAKKLGIDVPSDSGLALALGSCAVSPMDMAAAYGTIARGGIAISPWTVRKIDDLNGHEIESCGPVACRVLPEQPVAQLVDVLKDVVTGGTGTMARLSDRPVAGKTGTADQARDLWFIGFTPDMVTAVWGGSKENKPIADKHVTGGSVMARVWRDYNVAYYAKTPTPAGDLLASKSRDPGGEVDLSTSSQYESGGSPSYHRHYRHENQAAIPNPTNGVVTRNAKGITDYSWQH